MDDKCVLQLLTASWTYLAGLIAHAHTPLFNLVFHNFVPRYMSGSPNPGYAKLVASSQVSSLLPSDAGNNSVSFLEHMLNPPVKSWLMVNPLRDSKLSCLDMMELL